MLVYDPAADRWTTAGEIPEGLNHSALATVEGKLYIIGGFRESSRSATGAVRIYDPAQRTWRDGAPMPTARGALAVAVLDGKIHAIGGNAAEGMDLETHDHGVATRDRSVGTHEVYDPAQDKWTRLEPMFTARNHLGAAAIAGKIHVVGGRVPGDMELTTHEIYDPATDSWDDRASDADRAQRHHGGRPPRAPLRVRRRDGSKMLLQDLRRGRAVRPGNRPLGAAPADADGEARPRCGVVR